MTVSIEASASPVGVSPVQFGAVRDIPLNKLKASPRNARRVGHSAQDIEARAASIRAKGLLQPLVVEPEVREGGEASGYFLVTIGEGRRQALKLLAKRKLLTKVEPVRCVVDTTNDPLEISLDENVSRRDMHPADQFEAFRDLAERKGWSADEIGARFGVSAQVVRQRLRLGSVAPALLDLYRQEALTLDQLMAFGVTEDHERQMQVFDQLAHNRQPYAIRRAMTEAKVAADDRRAVFVGLDAYLEAGGAILRDLFTEDHGGWLEDVVLLDRLVAERLAAVAAEVRDAEGWKWASAHLAYPHGHGCSRIWEERVERSQDDQAKLGALVAEREALIEKWADLDELPSEVEAQLIEIDRAVADHGHDFAYDPEAVARAGVIVVLGHDGDVRIDRGFMRPEDEPIPEPEADDVEAEDAGERHGGIEATEDNPAGDEEEVDEPLGDPEAPLSARLIADLTAHRTAALRDALAQDPDLAQVALVHVVVMRSFGRTGAVSCLDVRLGSHDLSSEGEGIEDSRAGLAIAQRHAEWARQVPAEPDELWDFVVGLDADSRASLLAHCVALSLNAVHGWERRPGAWLHADQLAAALDLDMNAYWSPTAERYLGRVTKARVLVAVAQGASPEAAGRLENLKKPDMVEAAEPLLAGTGWLPALLRTPGMTTAADTARATSEEDASGPEPQADALSEGDV